MSSIVADGPLAAEPEFARAGLTWSPGPTASVRFGIGNVADRPTGTHVLLFVIPTQPPGGWEVSLYAKAGDLVPYQKGAVRVVSITRPDKEESDVPGSPGHGGATLQALASSAAKDGEGGQVAYLPEDARLKLAEKEPLSQNVVRVEAWLPDTARPFGAVLVWMYEELSAGLAKPEDIHRATVHAGSEIAIGTHHLHIRAITPRTVDHPAWTEVGLK